MKNLTDEEKGDMADARDEVSKAIATARPVIKSIIAFLIYLRRGHTTPDLMISADPDPSNPEKETVNTCHFLAEEFMARLEADLGE